MKHNRRNWLAGAPQLLLLTGVFCILIAAGFLTWRVLRTHGRVLPNVSIGSIDVGGLTASQAETKLRDALHDVNIAGIGFTYGDQVLTVAAVESRQPSAEGPIAYDVQGMVETALAYGHEGNILDLTQANIRALLSQVIMPVRVDIDRPGLKGLLAAKYGSYERRPRNADFDVQSTVVETALDESATGTLVTGSASSTIPVTKTVYAIDILPDVDGFDFDYGAAINAALAHLGHWRGGDVRLTLNSRQAEVATADATRLKPTAENVLNGPGLNLASGSQKWPISAKLLSDALTLERRPTGAVVLGIRPLLANRLVSPAATAVGIESKPTRFQLTEDESKVDQDTFVGGQVGKTLDREATVTALEDWMTAGRTDDVPVVVSTVYDSGTDALAERLGVRELLGVGTSNYSGSPTNRQKNIANGARLLGGLIIPPGEEFSTLNALKPFTEENGYFPELVIKDKRTKPEVGGGLCQVGTTMFRATLDSGLPVTMRQNHSYRVTYYEPAGTDATIYDPAPDFKFVNDTGHSVVVITKVLPKSRLRFEFWGTRDGRTQSQGPIRLWDETEPPAPKMIETSSLEEGKTRCFESAHKGAKTNFTYTITYPDGTANKRDFFSLYKPWQQQCLIGKTGAPNIIIAKDGSIKELPTADTAR